MNKLDKTFAVVLFILICVLLDTIFADADREWLVIIGACGITAFILWGDKDELP